MPPDTRIGFEPFRRAAVARRRRPREAAARGPLRASADDDDREDDSGPRPPARRALNRGGVATTPWDAPPLGIDGRIAARPAGPRHAFDIQLGPLRPVARRIRPRAVGGCLGVLGGGGGSGIGRFGDWDHNDSRRGSRVRSVGLFDRLRRAEVGTVSMGQGRPSAAPILRSLRADGAEASGRRSGRAA